jgi:uncharacterized membrane protein
MYLLMENYVTRIINIIYFSLLLDVQSVIVVHIIEQVDRKRLYTIVACMYTDEGIIWRWIM